MYSLNNAPATLRVQSWRENISAGKRKRKVQYHCCSEHYKLQSSTLYILPILLSLSLSPQHLTLSNSLKMSDIWRSHNGDSESYCTLMLATSPTGSHSGPVPVLPSLHGVTSQRTVIFTVTALRISSLTPRLRVFENTVLRTIKRQEVRGAWYICVISVGKAWGKDGINKLY